MRKIRTCGTLSTKLSFVYLLKFMNFILILFTRINKFILYSQHLFLIFYPSLKEKKIERIHLKIIKNSYIYTAFGTIKTPEGRGKARFQLLRSPAWILVGFTAWPLMKSWSLKPPDLGGTEPIIFRGFNRGVEFEDSEPTVSSGPRYRFWTVCPLPNATPCWWTVEGGVALEKKWINSLVSVSIEHCYKVRNPEILVEHRFVASRSNVLIQSLQYIGDSRLKINWIFWV